MNTLWSTDKQLMINPPNWEAAFYFLDTFTQLEDEFMRIELAATGMFELDHPETAEKLDLEAAVRAVKLKARLAKDILRWIAEHEHLLNEES
ncbi:MAG: hypothetical protein F6J97_23365 [Leptolyngbya sp. SIO4C1]|nr:hypothetical protein [Leptolyngbya sp. SIO4C1]